MRYTKPALTFEQQFDLMTERGLVIPDRLRAIRWLKHISYYRLSAYFVPFKTDNDRFIDGTSFDQIADLYIFDRRLRLILLDAIERIEVCLRTDVTYELGHRYGAFGHLEAGNFAPRFNHAGFLKEVEEATAQSSETFIGHFKQKYKTETHLPLWMATELLSFGCVSRLYSACDADIKRKIARRLDVPDHIFASWMRTLSYVRNVCSHHSRLWNRELAMTPVLPRTSPAWSHRIPRQDRLYSVLVIVRHCLGRISPRCKWRDRLVQLFDQHPHVDASAMGIPPNWMELPLWHDR